MNSGLSGMGHLRKSMAYLFSGGFVRVLLVTNLSPWHHEIGLTNGAHFEFEQLTLYSAGQLS